MAPSDFYDSISGIKSRQHWKIKMLPFTIMGADKPFLVFYV